MEYQSAFIRPYTMMKLHFDKYGNFQYLKATYTNSSHAFNVVCCTVQDN